jgi:hypothetical protein
MMVSFAVAVALLAAAPADRPPANPPPARERHLHLDLHGFDMPDLDFDLHGFEMPDFDVSDLHLSGLRSLETLRSLGLGGSGMLALRDEEEEDQDRDEEANDAGTSDRATRERDRATRERDRWGRGQWDGSRWGSFGDETFGEKPSARATGKNGAASLAVKGPVTFRLRVQSGEVEVMPSDKPQIALSVGGVPITGDVQILQFGDRIEAEFGGHRQLRRGKLRVELPKGSNLEFDSTSGDVVVQDVGGDVRVRTMSGDVKVKGARNADVQSVSGDVTVNVTGPKLRLHLVSGTAIATTADPAVQLAFQSASGNLEWSGVCAKGCHLSTETVSGDIKLHPDAAKSSFQLSYASHSGDLRDELNLEVKRAPKRKHGMGGWLEAVYGKGEGVIECDAFSGDVIVTKK